MERLGYKSAIAIVSCAAVAAGSFLYASGAQQSRDVSVTGNDFTFSPSRIEVQRNDVVKVTFTASDIAHSFTIDSYRIAKRAGAGQSVTFEFRADQPGEHTFTCNLTHDERCRNMKGVLVVR